SLRRERDDRGAPWPPPSEFMLECVHVRETLVVLERDGPGGDVEDKGAAGAVVVFPAVIETFEIIPGDVFDGRFKVDELTRIVSGKLKFDLQGKRNSLAIGIPGLDAVELAGIAGAVIVDGDAVNTGGGKSGENDRFVLRAGFVSGIGGLHCAW